MHLPRETEKVRFCFKYKNVKAFDVSQGFRKQRRGREDATQRPMSTLDSFILLSYRHTVSGIKTRPEFRRVRRELPVP